MGPQPDRTHVEREHFDRLAEAGEEIWWGSTTAAGRERLRRRARLIVAALAPRADPLVLELGCGTGALSVPLLQEAPDLRLVGLDISPRSLAVAARRCQAFARARFAVGSALELEAAAGTYDAVVGNSVLHHLPLGPCIAEAWRVLKPGGLLWFSEPNMLNPQIAVEKNVKPIGRLLQNSPDETAFFRWPLARVLRRAGFAAVSVQPYDFLHPIVPSPLVAPVRALGSLLERLPLLREVSGSLIVSAVK